MRQRLALLGALFGSLLVVLALWPPAAERLPALTVYSAAPTGGKALRLWLEELGYPVAILESPQYRVPSGTATVMVLAPTRSFDDAEMVELERWVRGGGTLLIAADGLWAESILERFGFGLSALPYSIEEASPPNKGLLHPEIGEVTVRATDELLLGSSDATPFLVRGERVLGASAAFGSGRVSVLSAPSALSNEALRDQDNARLALSLLGHGAVVFDELHHGFGVAGPRSILALLLDRGWGRAVLWAGLLTLGFLLLRGRRFGRAQPVLASRPRSLSEYVSSLASLYRAAGKRAFVVDHFRHRFRRDVASDLGLPADASDEQIEGSARALGRDPSQALTALKALEAGVHPSEAGLLNLVRHAERARTRLREAASG